MDQIQSDVAAHWEEMLTLTRGLVLAVVFCVVAAPTEARLASGLVDHDKIKRSSSPLPQRDW